MTRCSLGARKALQECKRFMRRRVRVSFLDGEWSKAEEPIQVRCTYSKASATAYRRESVCKMQHAVTDFGNYHAGAQTAGAVQRNRISI